MAAARSWSSSDAACSCLNVAPTYLIFVDMSKHAVYGVYYSDLDHPFGQGILTSLLGLGRLSPVLKNHVIANRRAQKGEPIPGPSVTKFRARRIRLVIGMAASRLWGIFVSRECLLKSVLVFLTIWLASCGHSRIRPAAAAQSQNGLFFPLVDALNDGFSYAYAPSIILKNGTYHVFFCSKGWLNYPSWDAIRYTTSVDGKTWSIPKVMLQATAANGKDMAACDPSLV